MLCTHSRAKESVPRSGIYAVFPKKLSEPEKQSVLQMEDTAEAQKQVKEGRARLICTSASSF